MSVEMSAIEPNHAGIRPIDKSSYWFAMILVTGAAGKTGMAVVKALAARGETVRAMVRRQTQQETVINAGATEVVTGDLENGTDLTAAMRGIGKLYFICPNMRPNEFQLGQMAIAAAKNAGISLFAYHSVLHPQTKQMAHHWAKMQVEAALFESGLPFVILQPTAYYQNIFAYWRQISDSGIYPIPYPIDAAISMVDLDDLGEAAGFLLTDDRFLNGIYELVGSKPYTPRQIAGILSDELGKQITAKEILLPAWRANASEQGLSGYVLETLSQMFQYYAKWGLVGSAYTLTTILGRQPTTLAQAIRRHVATTE